MNLYTGLRTQPIYSSWVYVCLGHRSGPIIVITADTFASHSLCSVYGGDNSDRPSATQRPIVNKEPLTELLLVLAGMRLSEGHAEHMCR